MDASQPQTFLNTGKQSQTRYLFGLASCSSLQEKKKIKSTVAFHQEEKSCPDKPQVGSAMAAVMFASLD